MRLRLERGGEVSPRRGLVDAQRALSGVQGGLEADGLARRQIGLGRRKGSRRAGRADRRGWETPWRAAMIRRPSEARLFSAARVPERALMHKSWPRPVAPSGSILRPG